MKDALLLAVRYLAYHRLRTAILVVCLSLAIFLPVAVHRLVDHYQRTMIQRAQATPLVIGARGSAYDLVLSTVYFKGSLEERLTMEQVEEVRREGLAVPVPMYVRFTAGGHPIVGTSLDYFSMRGLSVSEGTLSQVLGDVVLGASAARRLDLSVGDKLLSDDEKLYDISSTYPLLMRVVGILDESGTADDLAIFADVRTTWIIEGIGHGHAGAKQLDDPTQILSIAGGNVVMSGAVVQYNEITAEAVDDFHFHGEGAAFPLSAIIALPRDAKSSTILSARYHESKEAQVVVPRRVVDQMMDIVLRVRRFLDAVFVLVLISTAMFLILVVLLSIRLRRGEFETLHKLGCRRRLVLAMQSAELALLLTAGSGIAAGLTAGVMWYVVHFDVLL